MSPLAVPRAVHESRRVQLELPDAYSRCSHDRSLLLLPRSPASHKGQRRKEPPFMKPRGMAWWSAVDRLANSTSRGLAV